MDWLGNVCIVLGPEGVVRNPKGKDNQWETSGKIAHF